MCKSTALYVYWDSHAQFKAKLYPIAEAAYRKFGTQAVVVTVCSDTFYQEVEHQPWLKIHKYDDLI